MIWKKIRDRFRTIVGLGWPALAFTLAIACCSVSFGCENCIAQAKAERQARNGIMRHDGTGIGSGTHEGVGYSSVSEDDAIRRCCYWNKRTAIGIGVARGIRGFYATVIYR